MGICWPCACSMGFCCAGLPGLCCAGLPGLCCAGCAGFCCAGCAGFGFGSAAAVPAPVTPSALPARAALTRPVPSFAPTCISSSRFAGNSNSQLPEVIMRTRTVAQK
ncbi:hypothetical protein GEV43_08010 [Actinomadura sp. J1-007]|nr:hypothetical protein [Actinomadura sp. J1-007]